MWPKCHSFSYILQVFIILFKSIKLKCVIKASLKKVQIYRVFQEECARLREGVPYVKVYRYNPKHHVQSWTVTEIMAREKCVLLWGSTHCTCQLTVLSISVLECGVILRLTLALTAYLQADKVDQTLRETGSLPSVSCILLGTLRTTMTWVRVFL
jgi:hypothetical protein